MVISDTPLVKEHLPLFTKLRNNNSNLNNESVCIRRFECENYYHIFIECPIYANIRRHFLRIYSEIYL